MANPKQVVGRAKVLIDGATLPTAGDTKLDPGGPAREGVNGDYEVGGFKETTKEATLELSLLANARTDAAAFGRIDNSTITILFDNGQRWMMRNAWSEGAPQIDTSDGKLKGVLHGPPAERVA